MRNFLKSNVKSAAIVAACILAVAACKKDADPVEKNEVIEANGVTLNKTTLSLSIGDSETLTATITPDNVADKTLTWSSSASAVAPVTDGTVTAAAAGTATITVTGFSVFLAFSFCCNAIIHIALWRLQVWKIISYT